MIKTVGYAATFFNRTLKPKRFERQEAGPDDVELDLTYCGVCHSDVHQVNNDWKNTVWPCVPGHEVVGRVAKVGSAVTRFAIGDIVTVGCMIDSCGTCYSCEHGDEQYCESESGFLGTYNGPMNPTFQNTYGGYANKMVVREKFLLKLPDGIPPEVAGPILCAGVTTYSPLKHWGVRPGMKVGIIGLGGLGHMAVQIAKAMGAEVSVISTTPEKKEDAFRLGALRFIVSSDKKDMKDAAESLDLILNTIPEPHEIEPYLDLVHRDGVMVIVGVLAKQPQWDPTKVLMHRKTVAGSLIGSLEETREVLDFCAEHRVLPQVELIGVDKINEAFRNIEKKKVRYRYVIDLATLPKRDVESLDSIKPVSHRLPAEPSAKTPSPPVHAGEERKEFLPTWGRSDESARLL